MEDENRFSGRMKRYSQVGMSSGKIASKFLGRKLTGNDIFSEDAAAELRLILGNLKGPIMKVAQIMSTIPDALPPELSKELAQLQSNAPPMGWSFVKRRMKKELGADWQSKFQDFEKSAGFAASLGQVHKAHLASGEEVVCKLQYPDMASVIEADLKQLSWFLAVYNRYDKAIKTDNIKQELEERLREELDYVRERNNIGLFAEILEDEAEIHTPKAFADLSTDRLLTMTYLEGQPLLKTVEAKPELRDKIAYNLFKAWYKPLYHHGVIHGDPHLGNYTITENGELNLLDFGSIRFFKGEFVQGILLLYEAIRDNDQDKAAHAYETWGFENLSHELIEVLNRWANYIYTPLLEDKVRRIQDTDDGQYGATIATDIHKDLKRLGGIAPPREFVLVDRAAVGLGSVFMRIKAELNWHDLFHELLDEFSVDRLNENQETLRQKHMI